MWTFSVMTLEKKGSFLTPRIILGLGALLLLTKPVHTEPVGKYGFLSKENSSYVLLENTLWNVGQQSQQTEFSFRTCDNGELLYQTAPSGDFLNLTINNGTLEFHWSIGSNQLKIFLGRDLNKNEWWTFTSHRLLGNLFLNVTKGGKVRFSEIISNSTFRTYFTSIDLSGSAGLYIGRGYTGCLLEGPNVMFVNNPSIQAAAVEWSNTSCMQTFSICPNENGDIDDCYAHPCVNGGTCVDGANTYTCTCPHLFNGTRCENSLVQYGCAVQPCLNGGTCIVNATDVDRPYRCNCTSGLMGFNCENNIDECGLKPCQNEAPCIDKVGGYECNCTNTGYNGTLCDNDIDECDSDPGPCGVGTCFNNEGSFSCQCPDGYFGTNCTDIDECRSSPCQNSGLCVNLEHAYRCDCINGYSGTNCEDDVDYCANVTCPGNFTECVDQQSNYICRCKPGYSGTAPTCVEINECATDPCANGAGCADLINAFKCICPDGVTGTLCDQDIDECNPNPCQNEGSCENGVNQFTCTCLDGFTGTTCDVNIQECDIGTTPKCENGGTCVDGINNYNCSCPDGWTGDACNEDINECDQNPPICLNGGECKNKNGSFECWCGPNSDGNYWTGSRCDILTNHCFISDEAMYDSPACRNGATCQGIQDSFRCFCAGGFLGPRCKEVDECYPEPCYFNSTCHDGNETFTCDCVPGSTGHDCSINIDDCTPNPCGYGQCIDKLAGYDCNCTDTGFKGDNCEINIDDCEVDKCIHNSTCNDLIKDYNCSCYDGYEGKNCEIDINECADVPCHYNSPCFEKSNKTLYDINYPGFEGQDFSYANAAGFVCECVPGSAGLDCSENIDDCVPDNICNNGTCEDLLNNLMCHCYKGFEDHRCQTEINECDRYQPCENGASCVDKIGDYDCDCLPSWNGKEYVGKNCTFELTECQNNLCQQGSTCRAFLINETLGLQDYECLCADGFTGDYCNISTTVSFDTESYVSVRLNADDDNVTLSFRFQTTLRDAVLFAWEGADSSMSLMFVSVELKEGNLLLAYQEGSPNGLANYTIPDRKFNHEAWQTVKLSYNPTSKQISMMALGTECSSGDVDCSFTDTVNAQITPLPVGFFGSFPAGTSSMIKTLSGSPFVGCMEDITIQGTELYLDIGSQQYNFTQLTPECPRTQQCFASTCTSSRNGQCVDLWNTYRCDCHRPFLGGICNESYVAATFQYNNLVNSSATFDLDGIKHIFQTFDLSFFIRTRQSRGLIVFFGELVGNAADTFITLEVESGHLGVRLKFCAFEKYILTGSDHYANGEQHLVRLVRDPTSFRFYVDGVLQSTEIVDSSCNFNASNLLFGGILPDTTTGRRKRETVTGVNDFSSVPNYKGTIQDIQLGKFSLQFFPNADPAWSELNASSKVNLTRGEQTDQLCDQLTPCNHNSTCTDQFFNDYSCLCMHGYRGKNCSELDFCVTGKCPDNSQCRSLDDGFECISSATFDGDTSMAMYSHTLLNTTVVSGFSFKFRTYAMNGDIMKIGNGNLYYKVKLIGEKLTASYKLNSDPEVSLTATLHASDARWYLVNVTEETAAVTLTVTDPENVVVSNVSESKPPNGESLNSLVQNSASQFQLGLTSYQGCLEEVRIEEVLLPFFSDDLFINNTSVEKFILQQENFVHGCQRHSSCVSNQCRDTTSCMEDYYTYACNCSSGYEGRWCQNKVNHCVNSDCLHGICVNLLETSKCECFSGFTGTRCQTDIDECDNGTVCQNNGVCQNVNGTYTCDCKETSFIGDHCEIPNGQTCSDNPCVNGQCNSITLPGTSTASFNCTCDDGWSGYTCIEEIDYCIDLPCQNGGTCSSLTDTQTYSCQCATGFIGDDCDVNKDDCPSGYCRNDGVCVDGVDTFACNCTDSKYYTGPTCNDDIDECDKERPCQNGATCNNRFGAPGFMCNCGDTGFMGIYCEDDINECDTPDRCKNGATCTNTIGDYNCNCTDGYEGKTCQTPNCANVNCSNGAACTVNSTQQWVCNCPDFYEGTYCKKKGPCADNPCSGTNTVSCSQDLTVTPYDYTCTCKPGWENKNCTADIDECTVSNDCENGATCNNTLGSYNCICVLGYSGRTCGTDIDECLSNPCNHEGYCEDLIGKFECNCTGTGYRDETCNEDVDECLPETNPCYNGATCVNSLGSYTCTCVDGYEGQNCDVKSEPVMSENITWYIVGPAVALVLILITIGVIWFLICVRNKRATHGVYSPSRQEMTGSRVELGNVMKKPPLERLI